MRTLPAGETLKGKKVCIIGRSNIVGLPLNLLMIKQNATVSICHRSTPHEHLLERISEADILITAMGDPWFIKPEWLK